MAGRLEGRVTLISGVASGQGRAAALRFAAEGALVVGCDIDVAGSKETVEQVRALGYDMLAAAPLDPSDPGAARTWIDDAITARGRIDVLYNNAGAVRHAPIESFPVEDWRFSMRNEIDIVFFPTRAAWPHLMRTKGVVISTASVAGHLGQPGMVAHCAGKAAVIAMARVFAAEGGPHGIRSYSISPGPILVEGGLEYFADPANRERAIASTILGRLGEPAEVAGLACFLASDEASYMTGVDIPVDAGEIIKWR
ncbi:MAG TPA: SDR family NAD(P)-dependent oxidoreductase [Amycolatopsis sp.]|nr:SDR family NAD(P)-dependent oxidoreductase [Amycolatopsis sp.]